MLTLREYAERQGLDLQDLAFLCGISYDSLFKISSGECKPDPVHIRALKRVLPQIDEDALSMHSAPAPMMMQTNRGMVPPGYNLYLLPVSGLAIGDLISFNKPRVPGSLWLQIQDLQSNGALTSIFIESLDPSKTIEIKSNNTLLVKVARLSST